MARISGGVSDSVAGETSRRVMFATQGLLLGLVPIRPVAEAAHGTVPSKDLQRASGLAMALSVAQPLLNVGDALARRRLMRGPPWSGCIQHHQ